MLRSIKTVVIMHPFGTMILFCLLLTLWFSLTSPNPQREGIQLQQQNTQFWENLKTMEEKMTGLDNDLKKTQEEKEKETSLQKRITFQEEIIAKQQNQIGDLSKRNTNLQDELQFHRKKLSEREQQLHELTGNLREKESEFIELADHNSQLASQLDVSWKKACPKHTDNSWLSFPICIAGYCVGFGSC
ncbi:centrosomal protein of 290 kDa-like isoform X2 [Stegostoma tigrinum]|uniref:centrosomal protein of 290 kDa-like isoform X2 n=1 Tax=Stegostoma tigrinum TaxID=3053191 RepID=UPI00286FF55F|nr:centrosomal protein of 290 kDa-like isoform X2 [Stegostoma tigrinum]